MAELEGKDKGGPNPGAFRAGGGTTRGGWGSDKTGQAVVTDVHPGTWRVDVVTKFDRRTYKGVQVGSAYLHYAGGEGINVMPEIGAKCHVTIPADGSEPFLSSFIAPLETKGAEKVVTGDGTTVLVSPDGKTKANPGDASFAAGRPRANPGDIILSTRDRNWIALRRGGVVEIGASPLAQRLYIPITNLVSDVAERYALETAGGAISWGLQEGPTIENSPTEWTQTFRVLANSTFADLRVSCGSVAALGERDADVTLSRLAELGVDDTALVYEVVVAEGGFRASSGEPASKSIHNSARFRYFVAREGGALLRSEASVYLFARKRLFLEAVERLDLKAPHIAINAADLLEGKGEVADLAYNLVKLGPGGGARRPAARMGDSVLISATLPVPCVITLGGVPTPATIQIPSMVGVIMGGDPAVLV